MTLEPLVYLIDPERKDRELINAHILEINLDCAAFADADAFLAGLAPNRLGCVFTELTLGGTTALQLVKRLRQRNCSLPVVLVTSYATVPLVAQAFKAGLFDIVSKPCEAFQLWEVATRAFEFHGHEMSDAHHRGNIKNRISHLTRQELQVMQMVLDGEPNKRIAAQLSVSPRTIVFRRKSLMQKMSAKSVAELACMILSVTSQNSRCSVSRLASLLDVFVASSLCESGDGLMAKEDGAHDTTQGTNGFAKQPR